MRVLILTGRLARHPWMHGPLVAALARALEERSHEVTLAADSVDDSEMFAGVPLHAARPYEHTSTEWPVGFARWACRARREIGHDVSLSLSRVAGADVWWPLEPTAAAWLARLARTRRPAGLAFSVARHAGVLWARAEQGVRRLPRGVERVLTVGDSAAAAAREALAGSELADRVVAMEHFTMLPVIDTDEAARLRGAARQALGIAPGDRVVLVSAPGLLGRLLDPLLRAARALPGAARLRVLVLARDAFSARAAAGRAWAAERVLIAGTTADPLPALAACDAAAAPVAGERGPFESGHTGRLAADALWLGRPVLAPAGAPGADLVLGADAPGVRLADESAPEWERALRAVLDDAWLERAGVAAEAAGRGLAFRKVVDAVERVLREHAG